ncbi:MAG TPA: HAD family phosphatase [Ilumatobacteraceae bacterium]|nr:HAD family phosphatase [Ilumatobacteraceae bacterium]
MGAEIRAVVFDFGGVLITPITRLLDEISEWHGVSMEDMLDVLMGPRNTSTPDHPWHRAERGEIPIAVFQDEIQPYAEAAGLRLRGDEYERLLCGEFDVHQRVVARIEALRAEGYRTALLTNSFKEFRDHLEAHVDFGIFDVVVDSSEVGCRKPEPEIYELTTRLVGARPEEILYLDDFAANLDGAVAEGWKTIHVTDEASALRALDAALAP